LLQADDYLLAMNFSDIIQIRFGPLVMKLHFMSTYFVMTLVHSFIHSLNRSERQILQSFQPSATSFLP